MFPEGVNIDFSGCETLRGPFFRVSAQYLVNVLGKYNKNGATKNQM